MPESERRKVVEAVRNYMARERISREEFAARARLGKSTVDKLATGIFSERTLLQIEARLNIRLREATGETVASPPEYGSYTREEGSYFLGDYVLVRPAFSEKGVIHAFHMVIAWSASGNVLELREGKRPDDIAPQVGRIHIPRGSNHIFISSNEGGGLQTVILTQLNVLRRMRGLMLTAGHAFASVYLPVALPVVMMKHDNVGPHLIGRLTTGSPLFDEYQADLAAVVAEDYARWIAVHP